MLFQGAYQTAKNIYLGETLKCYYVLIVLANSLKWEVAMDFGIIAGIWAWLSFWHHSQLAARVNHFPCFPLPVSVCLWVWKTRNGKVKIPVGQMPPESPLILLYSPALLCLRLLLSARVRLSGCLNNGGGYAAWQQIRGTKMQAVTHTALTWE